MMTGLAHFRRQHLTFMTRGVGGINFRYCFRTISIISIISNINVRYYLRTISQYRHFKTYWGWGVGAVCFKVSILGMLANVSVLARTKRPGWDDPVKEHNEPLTFWHSIWKENGPSCGDIVAYIRREVKSQSQKNLSRRKMKRNYKLRKKGFAVSNDISRNLWTKVRKTAQPKYKLASYVT